MTRTPTNSRGLGLGNAKTGNHRRRHRLASRALLIGALVCATLYAATGLGLRVWRGVDGIPVVLGLDSGACYVYWRIEPAFLSAVEFARRATDFDAFPFTLRAGLSSTGAMIPLWAPMIVLFAAAVAFRHRAFRLERDTRIAQTN